MRLLVMRFVMSLGGTDFGQSRIGVYTWAILPRMFRGLAGTQDEIVVMGTSKEFAAYEDVLPGISRIEIRSTLWMGCDSAVVVIVVPRGCSQWNSGLELE